METIAYDIVIVGGGAAGLRAAIAAAQISDRLSIALVSKVYPMRSHTVSAEGGQSIQPEQVARPSVCGLSGELETQTKFVSLANKCFDLMG